MLCARGDGHELIGTLHPRTSCEYIVKLYNLAVISVDAHWDILFGAPLLYRGSNHAKLFSAKLGFVKILFQHWWSIVGYALGRDEPEGEELDVKFEIEVKNILAVRDSAQQFMLAYAAVCADLNRHREC